MHAGIALHGVVKGTNKTNFLHHKLDSRSLSHKTLANTNNDIVRHTEARNSRIRGEFIMLERRASAKGENSEDDVGEEREELSPLGSGSGSFSDEEPESYSKVQMRTRLDHLLKQQSLRRSADNLRVSAPPLSIHYYKPVALRRFTYLPGNELEYSQTAESSTGRQTTHL